MSCDFPAYGPASAKMMTHALRSLEVRRNYVAAESTNRPIRPWDHIDLTKDERKGKTFEEMQAMRREKWEAAQGLKA